MNKYTFLMVHLCSYIIYVPYIQAPGFGRLYAICCCCCRGSGMTTTTTTTEAVVDPGATDDPSATDPGATDPAASDPAATDAPTDAPTGPYRRRPNKIILKGSNLRRNQRIRSNSQRRNNNPRNARTGIAPRNKGYSNNKKGKTILTG